MDEHTSPAAEPDSILERFEEWAHRHGLQVEIFRSGPLFGARARPSERPPAGQAHRWTYGKFGKLRHTLSSLYEVGRAKWGD